MYINKQINTVQPRYNALDTKIASLYLILVTSIQTDIGEKKKAIRSRRKKCKQGASDRPAKNLLWILLTPKLVAVLIQGTRTTCYAPLQIRNWTIPWDPHIGLPTAVQWSQDFPDTEGTGRGHAYFRHFPHNMCCLMTIGEHTLRSILGATSKSASYYLECHA